MSVELHPVELGFRRPFTHEVSQVLSLKNPLSEPVAFKVKTTAPKQYCVRPNSGRIEPGETVDVQVLLQAMKEDPPMDTRCRDKFLVQTVAISADKESTPAVSVWSHLEQTSKGSIQEKKIRVNFLPAEGSHEVNGTSHSNDGPPAYSSPSPQAYTPQHSTAYQSTMETVGSASKAEETPETSKNLGEAKDSTNDQPSSGIGAAVSAVTSAIPTSTEDVKAQLAEAKATISRLTQQAQEQVLRQRKGEGVQQRGGESAPRSAVQSVQANGVPVSIVAALCLLCFLLAYFFF